MPTFKKKFKRTTGRKFVNKIVKAVLHKQIENKYYDTFSNLASTNWNGTVYDLSSGLAVGTGTAGTGRIGIKVRPTKFQLALHFQGNPTATISQQLRVVCFRYRHESGVLPLATQILQNVGTATSYMTPYQASTIGEGRYTILSDKMYALSGGQIQSNTAATAYNSNQPYDINVRHTWFGKKVHHTLSYVPSSNAVDDGGFYVLVLSDTAANGPYISLYGRVTYEDA